MQGVFWLIVFAVVLLSAAWLALKRARAPAAEEHNRLQDPFAIKPYVQLGDRPFNLAQEELDIVWFAADSDDRFSLEVMRPGSGWEALETLMVQRLDVPGQPVWRKYLATLSGLSPGARVRYRVLHQGKVVFDGTVTARRSADQQYSFAVMGDIGSGRPEARRMANRLYLERPDFAVITGDMVYQWGRVSEYLALWFPVMNADDAGDDLGAPVLRSILSVAVPGNHDVAAPKGRELPNLETMPDALGYFVFWSQPLNGFALDPHGPNTLRLEGGRQHHQWFLDAAGARYPRMLNFSFDYANSHWLVLDGNHYMDWTNEELRAWIERDLASASAAWKFVAFHQPGFSCEGHADEQRMRLLSDIFERCGVDVVFSGHNHCYERSYPLRFVPASGAGKLPRENGSVPGEFTLDRKFDGRLHTRPDGVIYIVTGAGGAKLKTQEEPPLVYKPAPFTCKLINHVHSVTLCRVNGATLTISQIAGDGSVLDHLVVTRAHSGGSAGMASGSGDTRQSVPAPLPGIVVDFAPHQSCRDMWRLLGKASIRQGSEDGKVVQTGCFWEFPRAGDYYRQT